MNLKKKKKKKKSSVDLPKNLDEITQQTVPKKSEEHQKIDEIHPIKQKKKGFLIFFSWFFLFLFFLFEFSETIGLERWIYNRHHTTENLYTARGLQQQWELKIWIIF